MFQNKGENKSRLCYSLQNHYICIAKSKCDTNISNHIGYFVSRSYEKSVIYWK